MKDSQKDQRNQPTQDTKKSDNLTSRRSDARMEDEKMGQQKGTQGRVKDNQKDDERVDRSHTQGNKSHGTSK